MNEDKLNQITESAGSVIQRVVKSTAMRINNKLEPTLKHKSLKIILNTISKNTGARLIVNSVKQNQKKHHIISKFYY